MLVGQLGAQPGRTVAARWVHGNAAWMHAVQCTSGCVRALPCRQHEAAVRAGAPFRRRERVPALGDAERGAARGGCAGAAPTAGRQQRRAHGLRQARAGGGSPCVPARPLYSTPSLQRALSTAHPLYSTPSLQRALSTAHPLYRTPSLQRALSTAHPLYSAPSLHSARWPCLPVRHSP